MHRALIAAVSFLAVSLCLLLVADNQTHAQIVDDCFSTAHFAPPFGTVNLPDFARYGTHSNHSC